MMGITGNRLANKLSTGVVTAPQNVVKVVFPAKTVVRSMQMTDHHGRPTYRRNLYV